MEVIQTSQILLPKQIYIGDRGELQCSFSSDLSFLREAVLKSDRIELDVSGFSRNIDETQFQITNIYIASSGADYYTLSVSFIPWKTGRIDFPEFDLDLAFGITGAQHIIRFEPIQIISLIENESNSTIRDAESPMLLPGTTIQLWSYGIAGFIIIIIGIRLIVKHREVALYFKNKKLLKKYKKNKKQALKKLYNLMEDSELPSHDIAEQIQQIIRNYLEVRFDYPFTHALTSELMNCFYKATLHLLSSEKEDAFIGIASTFTRTDYIRYSKDASFHGGEKESLISKIIRNIEIIETPEENKSPDLKEEGSSNA
ncbi:MAG: hypothetical protein MJ174_04630 [Treponema sp.]|nr:hypothetical protein [Treponema sp.]